MTFPHWLPNETNEEYHARSTYVGSSTLKTIALKTPAHFKAQMDTPSETTPAMILGTHVHAAVLEGRLPLSRPKWDLRTKAGKELAAKWDELNPNVRDEDVCDEETYETVCAIRDAVLTHPLARELVSSGTNECSGYAFCPTHGVVRKIRPDARNRTVLVDLKTTLDASAREFGRSICRLGYHIQGAFYLDTANLIDGEGTYDTFAWIAVETKPPFAVAVYVADEDLLERGRVLYQNALETYASCVRTGVWPGYGSQAMTISLPKWA